MLFCGGSQNENSVPKTRTRTVNLETFFRSKAKKSTKISYLIN